MASNGHDTIESALPVHYLLKVGEASFINDVIGSFNGSAPFMAFHVGDYLEPQGLIPNVHLPEGSWWKVKCIIHRITETPKSHITHEIGIGVEIVPPPDFR